MLDWFPSSQQYGRIVVNLSQIIVRPVRPSEESRYTELMQRHHYLGALPKIGNTIWYIVITGQDEWVALLSFSAAALKYSARDQWIGWSFSHQYNRLHLIANNSRFLILPHHHHKNLASKMLSLHRAIVAFWLRTRRVSMSQAGLSAGQKKDLNGIG